MMSSALSKRQQARNERALQDLIKSVPGNNVCADCYAKNPGTARCFPSCVQLLTSEVRMGQLERTSLQPTLISLAHDYTPDN
jgi:ribosomal protein L40E